MAYSYSVTVLYVNSVELLCDVEICVCLSVIIGYGFVDLSVF